MTAFEPKYPELKRWAYRAYRRARRWKLLVPPARCEACGATGTLHAHHDSYGAPLAVTWLCARCHLALHRGRLH